MRSYEKGTFSSKRTSSWHSAPFIQRVIGRNGWAYFCRPPEPLLPRLVKDFFANLDADSIGKIVVREVEVDLSLENINKALYLPTNPAAEFNQMLERPTEKQFAQALTISLT